MEEDPRFLSEQLITYIGNKRALLPLIGRGVHAVLQRSGKKKLRIWDALPVLLYSLATTAVAVVCFLVQMKKQ